MIALDSLVPDFHCTAVVNGAQRELDWRRWHAQKIVVFFFDSLQSDANWREQVVVLRNRAADLEKLHVQIALVCRDELYDIRVWLEQLADEVGIEDVPLTFLADADNEIAALFDVNAGDGRTVPGRALIDTRGFVRDAAVSAVALEMDIPYILHYVESIVSGRKNSCFQLFGGVNSSSGS